jgi:glycosyltransferase involved in cell wall biosynthesis
MLTIMESPRLIIVVPCYNEEEVLDETTRKLGGLLQNLITKGEICDKSFILYVNDGSKDHTWDMIEQYHKTENHICGVKLAGNVGHQNALMAGLHVAKDLADIMISIDADLQDDIHVIPPMVEKYVNEGCDIVYGVRKERKTDTWFKRNTALAFYKLMHVLGVKSVYNHADFRLMSKRAVEQLCKFRERNLFLRGMVPLIGYKTDCVYYDRFERQAGESKYPLKKMINFAIDGITSFSVKPVRMVFTMGVAFILISICILIYVILSLMSGHTEQGWASMILSMWFIGGCILVGLGIVGEYIGKIYIEVKDRPLYNIEQVLLKNNDKNEN